MGKTRNSNHRVKTRRFSGLPEDARRQAALLQRTGEIAGLGGWEIAIPSLELTWSPEVYRIHELEPTRRLTVAEGIAFYAPEARPVIEAAVRQAIEDGTPWDLELKFITARGRHLWVRTQGEAEWGPGPEARGQKAEGRGQRAEGRSQKSEVRPLLSDLRPPTSDLRPPTAARQIVRLIGSLQNITQHKEATEALRRSETRFRTLYDATSDAVMVLDEQRFLDCNPATLAIFGCASREEFCSKHPADLSPPQQPCGTDSLTLANQRIATAMRTGSHSFEWLHRRADTGQSFPAEVLLTAMQLDGRHVLQAVVRDITGRKRIEAAERHRNEQLLRFQSTLLSLRDHECEDLAGFLRLATEEIAHAIEVERVCIWFFDDAGKTIVCHDLFLRSRATHETGQELIAAKFPVYFRTFSEAATVRVDDACAHPATREFAEEYLKPNGITSMLDAPLRLGNVVAGVLCCEHTGPIRHWTRAEERFVISAAATILQVWDSERRRKAEAALRESENRLHNLAEATTEAIFFHENGIILDANPESCRLFGYRLEEFVGMSALALAAPELREDLSANLTGGKSLRYETLGLRKDGSRFPIDVSARNTIYQGRFSRVVCVRDLTQVQATATQLRENEARLRRVMEGSQQGYWERNVLTNEVTLSDRWFEMLGYQPSELEQKYETFENLLHPEDKPAAMAALQAHLEGRADHYEAEVRLCAKSGEWKWILTRGHVVRRDAAGRALYVSGTHTDITERKSMEARLRDRESLLSSINTHLVGSAIFRLLLSPDGRLKCSYVTPNVGPFLGVEPEEFMAHPELIFARVFPEDLPLIQAANTRAFETGEDASFTFRTIHPDGQVRWLHYRARLIERWPDGTQVRDGVATDITAIKEAEAEVRRQAEFLDILHQTTLDLLDRRELRDLMQAIVERAASLLAAPFGEMMLKENEELVVVACTRNQTDTAGSRLSREEAPLSWEAHDTSRPAVVTNYSARPDRRKIYDPQPLHAVAEFPILHGQACLGVLSLGRTEPGRPFSGEEIQRGMILAKNASLVMDNANIYADAVRAAEQRTAELRESEEKYRGLVTSISDGVFVVDAQGRLTFGNPALARLMGFEHAEQMVGRSMFEFIAPARLEEITEYFRQAVETGQTRDATIVDIVRPDGTSAVIEVKAIAVREGNQIVGMRGTIRDITGQKRAEQALTSAHRRTSVLAQLGRELAEAATLRMAALAILQAARQLIDWDSSWLHLWNSEKQQFEDLANFDLVDGEPRDVSANTVALRDPSPMVRRVMEQGPQLLLRDDETDQADGFRPFGSPRRSLSLMFVPIRLTGSDVRSQKTEASPPPSDLRPPTSGLIGVLSIQSYRRRAYDPAALDLLQTLASHCAGALARIQAASALTASEERFRLVWENASEGMSLTDPQGRIVAANEAFCRMYGQPRDQVEGQLLSTLYAEPESLAILARHLEGFARRDIRARYERRLTLADGRAIWLEVSSCFIETDPARPLLLGIFHDITERKQTEDTLRFLSAGVANLSGESFFNAVAGQLTRLLGVEIGFIGKLLGSEPPRIRTLGFCIDGRQEPDVEYLLAGTPCEAVIGKQAAIYPDHVAKLFPGDRMLADLHISSYAAIPLFDLAGHVIGHIGVMSRQPLPNPHRVEAILNLFAVRTAAEIERQRAERRFHDLFEFSPEAIVLSNEAGQIMMVNQQAEKLFGYAHGELLGQAVETLLPAAKRQAYVAQRQGFPRLPQDRVMAAGRPDLWGLKKDGTEFPVDISLSPLESDTGTWVAAAIRDLTELRRAQQQMLRAQRLESIGTLAGGVAHDLNNALAPIVVATEMLHERYPSSTELIDTMSSSAHRAADMVKQLLTFARGVEGARLLIQPLHLLQAMEKIIRSTFPKDIELRTDYAPNLQPIMGDTTQLHQVLLNLCVNARDAMPKGGTLTLAAENGEIDAAAASAIPEAKPGHYVVWRVTDTGTGIPSEILERIFEPFFSTKGPTKGTGLGLSTATGIVKSHGGFIRVHSPAELRSGGSPGPTKPGIAPGESSGRGATFAVYLPASHASAAPAVRTSPSS